VLRSLWLVFVYLSFMGLSLPAPFVATLGYVWVDTFQPQYVTYFFLNDIPVSMVIGIVALAAYMLLDRRSPPALSGETALQVLMAVWVTATLLWAERPDDAWVKWDSVFKTLCFTAFVPYVIRSRVQIEAFANTYVFALAANFVPFGLKTLISGGGYGINLGLQGGNAGLSEGGQLSTVCLMAVPLAIFLARHGQLIPRFKLMPLAYWGVAGLAVVTAVGTYERSALLGLLVLLAVMVVQSKHKIGFAAIAGVVVLGLIYTTSSAWNARIGTIDEYHTEGSAFVRLQVWRWTLQYAATHPLGGGFNSYLVNHIEIPSLNGGPPEIQFGRAFHSIYFEVLGEQGYPGLAMFLGIAALAVYRLRRTAKRARNYAELEWVSSLASALQAGFATFLTAGAFVGIAWQPMFWYFVAMSISLNAYMWRVERASTSEARGWRSTVTVPGSSGWRARPATPPIGSASRLR
jgi:probable O-glycosylation ligase (exosortase A-associated)